MRMPSLISLRSTKIRLKDETLGGRGHSVLALCSPWRGPSTNRAQSNTKIIAGTSQMSVPLVSDRVDNAMYLVEVPHLCGETWSIPTNSK